MTTINYRHGQLHFHKAQMGGWVGANFRGKFEKALKISFRGFDNQSRGVALHKR